MAESGLALVEQSRELDEPQQAALAALRAGQSFAQAATQAGVHRATVFRWVKRDPYFAAAFNAWRLEMRASSDVRLLKLSDKVVDVIEKALDRGDEKVAMKMLRQLQVMRQTKVGATDGETMKVEMDLREKRRHRSHVREMAKLLMEKSGLAPADQRRYIREHGYAAIVEQFGQIEQEKPAGAEKRRRKAVRVGRGRLPGPAREMEPAGEEAELTLQAVGGAGQRLAKEPAEPPMEAGPAACAEEPPVPVAEAALPRREGAYDWMIELEAQNAGGDSGEGQCD